MITIKEVKLKQKVKVLSLDHCVINLQIKVFKEKLLSIGPPPPVEASIDRLRSVLLQASTVNWYQAKDYCSLKWGGNGDLAIQRNALDVSYFSKICSGFQWTCWVGLRDRPVIGWSWINGPNISRLDTNWSAGHPGGTNCGAVYEGKLVDHYCSNGLYYLCENNHLVFVEEKKTWEEALDHCRALGPDASKRTDLLSFHDEEELSYTREVMTRAQTEEEVWIGLRWLAGRWLWIDRNAGGVITLPECPANGNHCGTLSGGGQQARSCGEKRRFFCLKQAN
ncbi:unnamed protein product [Boreogadus saida]